MIFKTLIRRFPSIYISQGSFKSYILHNNIFQVSHVRLRDSYVYFTKYSEQFLIVCTVQDVHKRFIKRGKQRCYSLRVTQSG